MAWGTKPNCSPNSMDDISSVLVGYATKKFWAMVDTSGDCWVWTGHRRGGRYGKFWISSGVSLSAHRFSWILHNGSITEGLHVLHRCDNPPCVNPLHLFLGTNKDNYEDSLKKRRRIKETHRKLTDSDIREIRRLYVSGTPTTTGNSRKLASRFNVAQATIRRIANRSTWKDLE